MHLGARASSGCNLICAHLATLPGGPEHALVAATASSSSPKGGRSQQPSPAHLHLPARGSSRPLSVSPSMIPLTKAFTIVARAPRKGPAE
jgi:hypothetical protein